MDYESFLSEIYTPIRAIEALSEIIYLKTNDGWDLFSGQTKRKDIEELLALNFAITLTAQHLLYLRKQEVNEIQYSV